MVYNIDPWGLAFAYKTHKMEKKQFQNNWRYFCVYFLLHKEALWILLYLTFLSSFLRVDTSEPLLLQNPPAT